LRSSPALAAVALAIAAFLVAFLIVPVAAVVHTAFSDGQGGLTFAHFAAFAQISLMRESFANSLWVAGMTVALTTVIAVPLAYLTVRFEFRGALMIQTLGVLPAGDARVRGRRALQLSSAARAR
jgi:iron(III) transport system permease protein